MNTEVKDRSTLEPTAFVREVVLPGIIDVVPRIDALRCRYKLAFRASHIHRWGIFALESIPPRRRVIEYTGERIDAREVWRRSFRRHLYIFWLDESWALDGAFGGSGAEFINHSCDPNLRCAIQNGRIFLSSRRYIKAGEELTLDYNVDASDRSTVCRCGTEKCSGRLTL